MLVACFRSASSRSFYLHVRTIVMVISIMGIILPESVSYSDSLTTWGNTSLCEFSLQLQKSPYREDFIARMATAVTNYWASYNDPAIASDISDNGGFSLISFERDNTGDQQGGDIDSFSKDCVSCHDGLQASDVTVTYRNNPGSSRTGGHFNGSDHPIGMDYASYASLGRRYKPVTMLNPKMLLVNGKVGCLTCHNPLNPEKSHLVMSDRRSALCLTCHDK
jgi:predicted CXXCH cytochrome family protein